MFRSKHPSRRLRRSLIAHGEGELLLGREDAVAQARALQALHESATEGTTVSL